MVFAPSPSIIILDWFLLYGYADESIRPTVRHNSVNLMWHNGNQWSPPSNNFWTNPTPDRAQRYYVMYVSTWTAHSKWCANCSLYMRSSSAMVSWNNCRWRSYWWHLGDASTTYRGLPVLQALIDALPQPPAVQAVVSDFEAALWLAVRDVFPGVAQRGCEFHFSQAVWRNVQSVGLQSAYAKDDVINRPRLPQDTGAMFPAGRCH